MILYAGPDQVMTVASGFAAVLGVLLIVWNKIVALSFKVLDSVKRLLKRKPSPDRGVEPTASI
jgi:hypothetical protein